MSRLSAFFRPRTIAFVGATEDEAKLGGRRYRSLVVGGFAGSIFAVHPRAPSVRGRPAFPTLRAIPEPVDLAVVVVPRDAVRPVIEDCAARNVPAVMVITAGFGEVDAEGRRLEDELAALVRSGGGRLLGPNCAGLYSGSAGINLGGAEVPPGPIALVSQSGNLLLDFNLRAAAAGLGFTRQATIGNAADLDAVDLIADCLDDPDTQVVLAYLEGMGEGRGRALVDTVRRHPARKPVVVLKPGRSEAGRRAALTHTGTLAGEDRVASAALRGAGILRADGIAEAWAITEALCRCPALAGDGVALVSDGGGHATLLADCLGLAGFALPAFPDATRDALARLLPPRAAIANPLDFAGVVESDPTVLPEGLAVCLSASNADAVVVAGHFGGYHRIGGAGLAPREIAAAEAVASVASGCGKPVVFQSIHADVPTASHTVLREAGIPVVRAPDDAVRMLSGLRAAARRPKPSASGRDASGFAPSAAFQRHAEGLLRSHGPSGALAEPETRSLLEAAGFEVPEWRMAASADEAVNAATDWPRAAMKLITPGAVHRSERGYVLLDLAGAPAIRKGAETLLTRCPAGERTAARLLVTPMLEPGLEIICGAIRDPQFGPTVMAGLGGTSVELLDEVVFHLAPLDREEARSLLSGLSAPRATTGLRRPPPRPEECGELVDCLVRLGVLLAALPELEEIELNPIIVTPARAHIADARAVVRRCSPHDPP